MGSLWVRSDVALWSIVDGAVVVVVGLFPMAHLFHEVVEVERPMFAEIVARRMLVHEAGVLTLDP